MKLPFPRSILLLVPVVLGIFVTPCESEQLPNIVFIFADDFGFNDVGYHGSQIQTPVLDKLAKEGVILENYYVQPICTPTRSTFLTGRYQIHTGLQHGNIRPPQPNCVPLEETTIAQKLKENGYKTHAIGKWHNGYYRKECMPTNRGFDSFLGYLTGAEDYYLHTTPGDYSYQPFKDWVGYDFRRDMSVSTKENGTYSTYTFTKEAQKIVEQHDKASPLFLYLAFQAVHSPLQVPAKYVEKYQHIKDKNRRIYAGMVSMMDEAVGNLTNTLKEKELWNNTVIVFSTDNGGKPAHGGKLALTRYKRHCVEGGMRGVGFIHSPLLQNPGRVYRGLVHVSDWLPTFVAGIAGGSLNTTKPLDGFDVWEAINTQSSSPRTELLHNIDPIDDEIPKWVVKNSPVAAIRVGDWKLISGYPGNSQWIPPPNSGLEVQEDSLPVYPGKPEVYLFNIADDPNEHHELSAQYPDKVKELFSRLEVYNSTAVPVRYPPPDLLANPALHGGAWSPW